MGERSLCHCRYSPCLAGNRASLLLHIPSIACLFLDAIVFTSSCCLIGGDTVLCLEAALRPAPSSPPHLINHFTRQVTTLSLCEKRGSRELGETTSFVFVADGSRKRAPLPELLGCLEPPPSASSSHRTCTHFSHLILSSPNPRITSPLVRLLTRSHLLSSYAPFPVQSLRLPRFDIP